MLLCLVGVPSHALTFSMSGPGLAPCGDQMCVDVTWQWGEHEPTTEASGQISLALPTPDPAVWELSGGLLYSGYSAAAVGSFDLLELQQVIDPPSDTFAGDVVAEYLVLGADGQTLTARQIFLLGDCTGGLSTGEDPVLCGDSNGASSLFYYAVPGDPAFLGPLTLRYGFDRYWEIEPLDETFYVGFGGGAQLVYDRIVPEPGTGLLVMTGLVGLACRQRRGSRGPGRTCRPLLLRDGGSANAPRDA